jgi:hypothetical protein
MPDDDKLLSQEQIDAMLSGIGAATETASGPDAPVKLKQTSMEEIRAKGGAPLLKKSKPIAPLDAPGGAALDEITQRLAQVEATLRNQPGNCPGHTQLQEELRLLASQVQAVNAKVDRIIASLQGTVGFGARTSFVCRSCQSKGHVAARLNCTSCGEENWWGWWPSGQQ